MNIPRINFHKHINYPFIIQRRVIKRKLRSRIRKKCKTYIYELALAELCGVIPDKEMKKAGLNSVYKALDTVLWLLIFEAMEKFSSSA